MQHPGWGLRAGGSAMTLLDPLSAGETRPPWPRCWAASRRRAWPARCPTGPGAIPLFIEEIVAHLVESGVLERDPEDRWRSWTPARTGPQLHRP